MFRENILPGISQPTGRVSEFFLLVTFSPQCCNMHHEYDDFEILILKSQQIEIQIVVHSTCSTGL